jgi:hypothetical protein
MRAERVAGRATRTTVALILAGRLAACGGEPAGERGRSGRLEFVDVAAEAGVGLVNVSGDPRRWYIPESNGNGAAWLDYDGDGDMDLFVANGAGLTYVDDGRRLEVVHGASSALYRNDGRMHFTDVTAASGAGRSDWGQTVATGDVDNDGDPDLYLGCFGRDVFLRNDAGRFVEATEQAGLGNELWAAGAVFADFDRDGALDLYVANYCQFDPEHPPLEGRRNVIDGVEIGWGPEEENRQGLNPGAPDVFYYGDGRGGFREATRAAGLELERPLCSYAVVASDVDGDGWQDILVANDMQPCNLFVNQGARRGPGQGSGTYFTEEAAARGFATNHEGRATSAMGLSVEDFDLDGDFDVFRSNFDLEPNSLHVNDGTGHFTDRADELGLAAPSLDRLGWGAAFLDADCDGDLDLLVANGHVIPLAERIGMSPWAQQSQLYEARAEHGRLRYADATARSGAGLAALRSARGLALADADDDGDQDALIVDLDHPPRLLENRSQRRGFWIAVQLTGTRSNRDGYGARVTVHAGGVARVREMRATQGLYSSHDPRLFFGLGPVEQVERVVVDWPSGARTEARRPALNSVLRLSEPAQD